jgi:hypothetical protein
MVHPQYTSRNWANFLNNLSPARRYAAETASELRRMARSTQHHAARMAHSLLPSAGKTIHPHLQNGVFKV